MTTTQRAGGASPVDFATFGDYGDFRGKQPPPATGEFVRPAYPFRGRITADGSSGYPAVAGRYHLYISRACPWAHRTAIVRALLGLEEVVSLSAVDPVRDGRGWAFREGPGTQRTSTTSIGTTTPRIRTSTRPESSPTVRCWTGPRRMTAPRPDPDRVLAAVNAEQSQDWNGASGREFIEQRERHERMLGRLTARLLAAAHIRDGEGVLDIGCGCGGVTILAARATRSGYALGADFSRIQVAEARRLATCAGVANARFEVADAQVHPFGAGVFDVVLSSFGVMFFDDPAAAFANVRRALRRGGRLAFLCWRTRQENPVFTTGFAEAAAALGLREPPGPSAAFSLADTGRADALLSGAGFGGIEFAKVDEPMLIGRDLGDVLEYERASPTATEILAGLSQERAADLTRQVRDRLVAYASPDGVTMPGAAWLVTAQAV